ncbi:unnamed protein product [Allacma fusca]|uniref:Uncharacterized protein n=1 Tax=Allacma fusca TaxID=39272 RepID=A0A8J2K2E2_9HEXA|nr:unnamed protein product [Allacma fusca]
MKEYEIRILYLPGGACDQFFSQTKTPMYLDIKKRMKVIPLSAMAESMMETALGPKSVQLNFDLIGKMSVASNLTLYPGFHPVKMSRTPIFDLPMSFALRKYSKFTETVSFNVGKLHSTGHFKKWFDQSLDIVQTGGIKWLKKTKAVGKGENLGFKIVKLTEEAMRSKTKPFTLMQFGLVFCCLVSVLSFGFVCFLLEIFLSCLAMKKNSCEVVRGTEVFVEQTSNCTSDENGHIN